MALSRPRAILTLDGRRLSSAEAALLSLRVLHTLGEHDTAEVVLWPSSKFAGARAGSRLAIAIGEEGSEADVWTGEVTGTAAGAEAVALDGLAATVALSRQRVSQTFLNQSVADIVRGLAQGAQVDQVGGDTSLAAYSVDERRSVWSHLLELARLIGADVGSSPGGALRFVPVRSGTPDHQLRHGADVLSWRTGTAAEPPAPTVAAYGAASEAGADQWHWIRRPPAHGGQLVAALRTTDAAETMTRALSARVARAKVRGQLRIVGRPSVRPGDLVAVSDLPSGDPGILRVRSVEHVLDARQGFATTLQVEGSQA
jgi:hypothetical protein